MAARNDRCAEEIIALHAEIFRLRAALLPQGQDKLWTFTQGLTPVEIRQFADILAGTSRLGPLYSPMRRTAPTSTPSAAAPRTCARSAAR